MKKKMKEKEVSIVAVLINAAHTQWRVQDYVGQRVMKKLAGHCKEKGIKTEADLLESLDAAYAALQELTAVRIAARKDFDRAAQADQYEEWLRSIGRISGCGHVDERLPHCIEEAWQKQDAELSSLREIVERLPKAAAALATKGAVSHE